MAPRSLVGATINTRCSQPFWVCSRDKPAPTLNEAIAVQGQSLTGDCHCARHLAHAHGGRARPQARHHGYQLHWSSRKCQVRLRDRRPRRRRHPSRTHSHSIRPQLPTRWTLPVKSFYEYVSSSYPSSLASLFNQRDGNQPHLEYRASSTVPHQGALNRPPSRRIFGASLGVTAILAFNPDRVERADECRKNMAASHVTPEMIQRRARA
jgi:hypothetical protein